MNWTVIKNNKKRIQMRQFSVDINFLKKNIASVTTAFCSAHQIRAFSVLIPI